MKATHTENSFSIPFGKVAFVKTVKVPSGNLGLQAETLRLVVLLSGFEVGLDALYFRDAKSIHERNGFVLFTFNELAGMPGLQCNHISFSIGTDLQAVDWPFEIEFDFVDEPAYTDEENVGFVDFE